MLKKIILILLTAAILNGCRSSKEINNASSEVDSASDINNSAYVEVTSSEINGLKDLSETKSPHGYLYCRSKQKRCRKS